MRKILLALLLLCVSVDVYAAAPSRQATYTSGTIISSTDVTSNEDAIFNYLTAGVEVIADNTIVNADVNSSANIQSDKLNLTSIAQGVTITSAGSLTNSGATTLNGAVETTGNTTIGNASGDSLTIDAGTWTNTNAVTWTLSGALTVSGTIANLGTVTTANIDGGTMDGVQIGGTTATGELIVNDSNDDADGLGSQGTSGQLLQSAGAGANPTWVDATNPGYDFIESNTFTATSGDITITETISAGDVYKIVFEGLETGTNTWNPFLRINADSNTNYDCFAVGESFDGVTTVSAVSYSSNACSAIFFISETSTEIPTGSAFHIEMDITARNTDTQVNFDIRTSLAGGEMNSVRGVGLYNAGTPTSLTITVDGSGTLTGRNYVYKLGSS